MKLLIALVGIALLNPNIVVAADAVPKTAPVAAASTQAVAPSGSDASKEPKYTGEALVLRNKLNELFVKSQSVNGKGAKKADARAAIENALDWDRIAKDCVPETDYKKAGEKNISEFKSLLKDVIVKTAYSRLDTFWKGAQYHFSKIDVTGDKAHTKAVFEIKDKEGAAEEFSLDYYLQKRGGKWIIYDIAFEDVRYSENIREQIKTFLGEKGFPNLLGKLRERRKELSESDASKG